MRNLNKPNRYDVASIQAQQTLGGDMMQADENGQYVEWRDYAWLLAEFRGLLTERLNRHLEIERLKAEVERLKENIDKLCKHGDLEIERLKAEVERLRKAGDWMCGLLRFDFVTKEWNAAKEGKPSV